MNVKDFVQLDNKIVVFKILDTKLEAYNEKSNDTIIKNLEQVKDNVSMQNIIAKLQNKYTITSNYKVK